MTKNKLTDLNNHLFEQLERLNDDELSAEGIDTEIKRSKAMSGISSEIIKLAEISLKAEELKAEYGLSNVKVIGYEGEE